MKTCNDCSTSKPTTEFNKNKRKSDGLQSFCRPCTKIRNNQSYRTSPKRRAKIAERNKANVAFLRRLVSRYKRFCGCRLCDEREPIALDLHHLDSKEKDDCVAKMIDRGSKIKVLNEIRKCVVLCSNCHRKHHAGIEGFKL